MFGLGQPFYKCMLSITRGPRGKRGNGNEKASQSTCYMVWPVMSLLFSKSLCKL